MEQKDSHNSVIKIPADIEKMFSRIARCYDFINHFASAGLDFHWRKTAAGMIPTAGSDKLIDLCCGTGDLAFAFAAKSSPPAAILGCDFSQEMLDIFKKKTGKFIKKTTTFSFLRCDCTSIPVPDSSFDIASCAFGLRNIPDLAGALKEMYRILKPGGQVCILEFSLPKRTLLRKIYLFYFCHVLPCAAGVLSGQPRAYKHLSDSVCRWHSNVDLVKELKDAGFSEIAAIPLTLSVSVVFTAQK
jgi:demethylmenaquinone methyltransferase / 2-methoxy-6-polyprenyl-1,4-benzoquinol methylase